MAIKYYDVQPFSTLREMWELAKNESGEKAAYMFKDKAKEICQKTYNEAYEDFYSLGTTPRQITDLVGSLCDLTSGSGDKGTPVIYIKGYFDDYTKGTPQA